MVSLTCCDKTPVIDPRDGRTRPSRNIIMLNKLEDITFTLNFKERNSSEENISLKNVAIVVLSY